jgi:hypothetical protein
MKSELRYGSTFYKRECSGNIRSDKDTSLLFLSARRHNKEKRQQIQSTRKYKPTPAHPPIIIMETFKY